MTEVKVVRSKVFNGTGARVPFSWVYSWVTPVEQRHSRGDGTEHVVPAGTTVEYGKGLASLRDMLRRKFGRQVKLVEVWKG